MTAAGQIQILIQYEMLCNLLLRASHQFVSQFQLMLQNVGDSCCLTSVKLSENMSTPVLTRC